MLPPIVGRLIGDDSHFRNTMRGATGAVAALGGAFAAVGAASFFKSAVMGASDLEETMSKVGVVFGQVKDQVVADAKYMADKFGIPKQQFLDASASIGLIGKASGISQDKLGEFSTNMASLAVDASSFYNVPLDEALTAIRSGLVGEAEPLRRFGVLLSAAAVESKAAEMGFKGVNGQLTEGEKVQARTALIMEQMKDATGDLERTQGSLANRVRELKGRFQNFTTEVGAKAVPAVLNLLDAGENLGKRLMPTFKSIGDGAKSFIDSFRSGFTKDEGTPIEFAALRIREVMLSVVDWVKTNWPAIRDTVLDVLKAIVGWVQDNWPRIKEIVSETMETVRAVVSGVVEVIQTIWRNFGSQITNVVKSAWDFITDIIDAALSAIRGVIDVVTGIITGDWGRVWDGIKSILSGVWDAMKALISTAIDLIKEIIKAGWEVVKGIFTGAWDAIKGMVREGVAWVVDKMLAMAEWVVKAAETAFGWIPVIGDKVHGLADKIEEFRNRTNAALRGIESKTIDITVRVNEIRNLSPDIPLATAVHEARLEQYALGGWVKGPVGKPQLAVVHGGEYVVTADDARGVGASPASAGGEGTTTIVLVIGDREFARVMAPANRDALIDLGRHLPGGAFGSSAA